MPIRDPNAPAIGWPLLPKPDENGQLRFPSLAESVRQSIQIILRTRPGEQLMRQHFGGGLANFLQEPNTTTTRRRINDAISSALAQYESRILLDRVEVSEVQGQPAQLRVEIAYRLRRTGQGQSMGLTLMLEA